MQKTNLKQLMHLLSALNVVGQPGGVHPRGDIDRIAPDVVLWLASANDACHHRAHVQAHSQHEVIVGVVVDLRQALPHLKDHLHQTGHAVGGVGGVALGNAVLGNEADGRHEAAAHRFDLLNGAVLF